MLKVFAVAAGAALLTFAPGAASAQNADDGMLCVYDAVSAAGYDAVAEAFLYGDEEEEANAALDKAAQTCSDQFKFSEGEAAAARDLGIYGVAVDVSSSLIILFTIFGAFLQHKGRHYRLQSLRHQP